MSLLTERFKNWQGNNHQESGTNKKGIDDMVKDIKENFDDDNSFIFDTISQDEEEEFKKFLKETNGKTISSKQFKDFALNIGENKMK